MSKAITTYKTYQSHQSNDNPMCVCFQQIWDHIIINFTTTSAYWSTRHLLNQDSLQFSLTSHWQPLHQNALIVLVAKLMSLRLSWNQSSRPNSHILFTFRQRSDRSWWKHRIRRLFLFRTWPRQHLKGESQIALNGESNLFLKAMLWCLFLLIRGNLSYQLIWGQLYASV